MNVKWTKDVLAAVCLAIMVEVRQEIQTSS